jgi:hypothetical protein
MYLATPAAFRVLSKWLFTDHFIRRCIVWNTNRIVKYEINVVDDDDNNNNNNHGDEERNN